MVRKLLLPFFDVPNNFLSFQFRILLITALIAQAMAYYPYQPQEEKMSEPMPQPQPQSMKKNQNGGTNGKGKNMAGDDDDGEQQQMMQAPPIRILNMKSQVKKDGTYSVSSISHPKVSKM